MFAIGFCLMLACYVAYMATDEGARLGDYAGYAVVIGMVVSVCLMVASLLVFIVPKLWGWLP